MYERQISMPGFDLDAQIKLKSARVLIIGVGGLGCPALMYLSASGIGEICIMEDDTVSLSNLNRQILYSYNNLEEKKVRVAKTWLKSINPYAKIKALDFRLSQENAFEIISRYDYVVDCCDNIQTRYVINDAVRTLGKVYVHASIMGYTGQFAIFTPDSCCYRCLYPNNSTDQDHFYRSRMSKSAIGVTAGIMGILQASELIKLITNIGKPIIGKLVVYNMLNQSIRTIPIQRNLNCPICAPDPEVYSGQERQAEMAY
jgi:adenylyltransferase/sulfurtransferase